MDQVVLVDVNDNELGTADKMQAHVEGMLHRAFSVFIFDDQGRMLLQQRAADKYHSPGLWTNTCCSHPRPGEKLHAAALRRLSEEMGFTTALEHAFSFVYKAEFDNGLTEHEFDHVFFGTYTGNIRPEPSEVSDYRYVSMEWVETDIKINPTHYTAWFRLAFPRIKSGDYIRPKQIA